MSVRSAVSVHHALIAILALGVGGFVAFHTALLFTGDQPTLLMARWVWLASLGVVLALAIYFSVVERRAFGEG